MSLLAILQLFGKVFCYVVLLWLLPLLVYRYAFHPLRKYPGPLLARLTDGYAGFQAATRRPHINMFKNLQTYGDVYRAGPNRLVFNSLGALQDIYFNPRVTKGRAYRHARPMDKSNIFDTPDKTEHRRKRQAIGQIVSDRALREFEPTMSAQIDIFLRQLLRESSRGQAVNMTPLCRRLAVDNVGFLSFGYPLNTQTDATNRVLIDAMGKAIYMINIFFSWPNLGLISPIIRWIGRNRARAFYQILQKMISARQSEPKNAKSDLYSIAVGDDTGDEGLYQSELWSEALFFVLAGGTTVATAICGAFFHLARHPEVYSRLTAEIRTTFSSGHDIRTGPKLASCIYLRAVIDEALRLSPPSLTPLWREPDASSDAPFVVDGHVIPRGTQVGIHLYSILHDARYYPEPFSFKPERWLEARDASPEEKEMQATMRRAQVSFGLGDRICAGKSMAYMETSLVLARVLWYFDFSSAPGEAGKLGEGRRGSVEPWAQPNQLQLEDILVADHEGPCLVFKPRGEFYHELEADDK